MPTVKVGGWVLEPAGAWGSQSPACASGGLTDLRPNSLPWRVHGWDPGRRAGGTQPQFQAWNGETGGLHHRDSVRTEGAGAGPQ